MVLGINKWDIPFKPNGNDEKWNAFQEQNEVHANSTNQTSENEGYDKSKRPTKENGKSNDKFGPDRVHV
jgi:hypothetical protein